MQGIVEKSLRLILWQLRKLKNFLKSSKTVQKLLYDNLNIEGFSDLAMHERMIADSIRINAYHDAIKRHIHPGDIVVDLGTGTGILAFFAAQQNPKKVYAIDHSDFINIAKKIAAENNVANIDFVQTNSRKFAPDEKVDVILHEQIGMDLFNENMVENLLDLRARVLKKTGKILPGKFEFFLEPVSLKNEHTVPYIWEHKIHGIDFEFLKNVDEIKNYKRPGYDRRHVSAPYVENFLCEPKAIFSFDINELDSESDLSDLVNCLEVSKKVVRPGRMDGLCLHFRVIFDDEINIDTSPLSEYTHWGNRLFRTERRNYKSGDDVLFTISMVELSNPRTWLISYTQ